MEVWSGIGREISTTPPKRAVILRATSTRVMAAEPCSSSPLIARRCITVKGTLDNRATIIHGVRSTEGGRENDGS